ncbi:hypothetical protein E2C01_055584 [Portunus trituberculatus]|uniref:Uncharacterized protein n=1 Tax=Portunus trituberculatus TaxID=210409 RepID=A0A5B7GN41_PORTR|nr:hypothetical protein [Portunus trituberculatus]
MWRASSSSACPKSSLQALSGRPMWRECPDGEVEEWSGGGRVQEEWWRRKGGRKNGGEMVENERSKSKGRVKRVEKERNGGEGRIVDEQGQVKKWKSGEVEKWRRKITEEMRN